MDVLQKILHEKNEAASLPERVYNDLLRDILTGVLSKNSKLTENRLCAKYKVSRTPMREAFRRLEMDGLVEYIPNRGEFVRGFTQVEIDDMLMMRADLEVTACRWAIERITDIELEQMSDIFKYMEFYTDKADIRKMIDINFAFHLMIYRATHDTMLEKTLVSYSRYADYCCPVNYFAKKYLERVLAEHRRIYTAFQTKDPAAGARAMRLHMNNTLRRSGL